MTARSAPIARLRLVAGLLVVGAVAAGCSDGGAGERDAAGSSTTATHAPEVESAARPSEGCGTEPEVTATDEAPGDVALTFDHDGTAREYRLGVPEDYDPDEPAPLVMSLHGHGNTAATQSVYTDMPAKAAARGFLTLTPDAGDGAWDMSQTGPDDDFLVALLDHVTAGYCVDLDRVHLAGLSLGAWRAALTACNHPERFASIALVTVELHTGCAKPVVAFHGTADRTVPYGEGADPGVEVTGPNAGLPGARDNVARWAEAAGCPGEVRTERIGDDIELRAYEDCPDGMDVALYTMIGADHVWPGSPIELPGATDTIDATELALDWFEDHPLRR